MGWQYICIGTVIGFGILSALIGIDWQIKNSKPKSNYTEFSMDENNHPMTYQDRGDYE